MTCENRANTSKSLFEITISTRYAKLAVPIFGSKAILTRTMPAWCLFNASGHGYRALTSLCRPRQPIEITDSNRLSGSDGCGGPARRNFFPPPRRLQAPVLQIGKGDAGHQRVPMQPGPGAAFEVAEPELLLELLVHLLARPARLDGGHQPPQRGPLRHVAEVVLRLAAVAPFADQPEFLARQAGARGVERPVRHAHPHGGEAGAERALGAVAPGDAMPALRRQHLGRRARRSVGQRVFGRPPGRRVSRTQLDRGGIDQLGAGDAARPGQPARVMPVAEDGAAAEP